MPEIRNADEALRLLKHEYEGMLRRIEDGDISRLIFSGTADRGAFRRIARRVRIEHELAISKALRVRLEEPAREDIVALNHCAYADFLVQVTKYMGQNSGYLRQAAATMQSLGRNEYSAPVAGLGGRSLIANFSVDADEEAGHDDYAVNDALALGLTKDEIAQAEPVPAVLEYRATLEDVTRSSTPLGINGAAWLLTMLAAADHAQWSCRKMAENLVQRSGIPGIEKAVSVWVLHGELDQHHIEDQTNEIVHTPSQYGDLDAVVRTAADIGRYWPKMIAQVKLSSFADYLRHLS